MDPRFARALARPPPRSAAATMTKCSRDTRAPTKPMIAALSTMIGKGTAKAKMPTKAATAMSTMAAFLRTLRPMRMTASMTMISTAALMPRKIDSSKGNTNRPPAISPPRVPCINQPT